jgi:hypothetical protein
MTLVSETRKALQILKGGRLGVQYQLEMNDGGGFLFCNK